MNEHPSFHECRSYVAANIHTKPKSGSTKRPPTVTISRQTGARGQTIGKKLESALRARNPKAEVPWTLFDDNLVTQVLEDHQLPKDLAKFMPQDAVGELEGSINEILGRHPSLWSLFEKTVDTIVRLSRMGNCIIVGRGGNCITHGFSNVINVRLIGSESQRIEQMVRNHDMSAHDAKHFVKDEDAARRRYIKKHFDHNIDDPHIYDLVINTDMLTDEEVVRMLVAAVEARQSR